MRAPILLAVLLPACYSGPVWAPYGSSVSVDPSTITTTVGAYCDTEPDYVGGVTMIDTMVVSDDDLPLENIIVEVEAPSSSGMYVLPQEAVKMVDLPVADEDIQSEEDIKEACTDDEGYFDNTNEWCAWYWDEENALFFQFGEDYSDAGGYAPTYFIGQTDNRGLMRFYLFMDCVYSEEATIDISIGVGNTELTIAAESE